MSYDLRLADKEGDTFPLNTPHNGGTMPVGGYYETDFNITYNYSWFYYQFLDKRKGLRWLYGKTGAETVKRLERAVKVLGDTPYFTYPEGRSIFDITEDDRIYHYWAPIPGNAGAALVPLLEAARQYPDGIWSGD